MIFGLYLNNTHYFTIRRFGNTGEYIFESVTYTESAGLLQATQQATSALRMNNLGRAIEIMHATFDKIVIL